MWELETKPRSSAETASALMQSHLSSLKDLFFMFLYECMLCVCSAHISQKRALGLLELELQLQASNVGAWELSTILRHCSRSS